MIPTKLGKKSHGEYMSHQIIDFRSDNVTGIIPEILQAIIRENDRYGDTSYGYDQTTIALERQLRDFFDYPVQIFPIISGTAANALTLASITPPYGAIFCHEHAHIHVHECGAAEFFTGGAKLILLQGQQGKLAPDLLDQKIRTLGKGDRHSIQPAAISLTQATEWGAVYQPNHVTEICKVAKKHDMLVHMDGARFANALLALRCHPGDITWRAGVDVLCLGATKAGAMAAEVVVFFNPKPVESFGYRWQRSGHVLSKMRFLSCQLQAFWRKGVWDRYATQANQLAKNLADGISQIPSVQLVAEPDINEVFMRLPKHMITQLQSQGVLFYDWPFPDPDHQENLPIIRLVTSFATTQEMVDRFLGILKNI